MKTTVKHIICLFTGLCFASCNYLDVVPDQVPTINDAFADRYAAEKSLASCYWALPRMAHWNTNPTVMGAMELIFNREYITETGMRLALGYESSTSPLMNYWGSTNDGLRSQYAGIRDCNTFLDNIGKVQDLPSSIKDRMTAEIKLLKAYMHFYLICYYGPICPLRESTNINESTQGIRVYREKIDDCFTYVLQLIDEVIASQALPAVIISTQTELGRFNRAAAYMLKAKVLTYWASPLFNGNTDYNNFLNQNGEPFFNQTYDASRWTKAAEACKEAIAVCGESSIRLYQTSDYIIKKPVGEKILLINTLRNSVTYPWNVEWIWANTPSLNVSMQSECMPRLESASSNTTPGRASVPFAMVDAFYSKNGVPIEEDKNYDYANRLKIKTGDEDHRYEVAYGEQSASMNFDREPRFYSSLGFDRGKWYGNSYKNEPDNDVECLYPRARFREFSSFLSAGVYNTTGYWPKKLINQDSFFTDANAWFAKGYPWMDMRYADLLLFCAEVLNESKAAPDAEVYLYIDEVRERAGLKGVVESWQTSSTFPDKPLSKTGMREIIRRERKIELAFEGSLYWDCRRWKTAPQEFNRLIQGWNVLESEAAAYYTVVNLYIQKFTLRDYFAPVPESDLIKNPQLVQNPGW
jgi:hypothetical protein